MKFIRVCQILIAVVPIAVANIGYSEKNADLSAEEGEMSSRTEMDSLMEKSGGESATFSKSAGSFGLSETPKRSLSLKMRSMKNASTPNLTSCAFTDDGELVCASAEGEISHFDVSPKKVPSSAERLDEMVYEDAQAGQITCEYHKKPITSTISEGGFETATLPVPQPTQLPQSPKEPPCPCKPSQKPKIATHEHASLGKRLRKLFRHHPTHHFHLRRHRPKLNVTTSLPMESQVLTKTIDSTPTPVLSTQIIPEPTEAPVPSCPPCNPAEKAKKVNKVRVVVYSKGSPEHRCYVVQKKE